MNRSLFFVFVETILYNIYIYSFIILYNPFSYVYKSLHTWVKTLTVPPRYHGPVPRGKRAIWSATVLEKRENRNGTFY
jgi:hypothetical protein